LILKQRLKLDKKSDSAKPQKLCRSFAGKDSDNYEPYTIP
jgi:hypothetical protein